MTQEFLVRVKTHSGIEPKELLLAMTGKEALSDGVYRVEVDAVVTGIAAPVFEREPAIQANNNRPPRPGGGVS